MSEKQKTYHLMILDRSSSMNSVRDATISGLNEQLESIRKAAEDFDDQEQIVCFVTFSNEVDTTQIWNQKIEDIEDFNRDTYSPDGMTALYDAIGMGVNKLRSQVENELANRQANVVITVFTDGQENMSREFTNASEVRELVEGIQETGQWTVAFIGCGGEEVFSVAQSMGIARGNTMSYDAGAEGTTRAFASMSNARYARTMMYSQSLNEESVTAKDINKKADFFANIDLDDDVIVGGDVSDETPLPETDGPDSAV
jgi:Mg-chelatase subunit ChlD